MVWMNDLIGKFSLRYIFFAFKKTLVFLYIKGQDQLVNSECNMLLNEMNI